MFSTEHAAMRQPAPDAAAVPRLKGLVNAMTEETLCGETRTICDGIVIRQSRIEGGKIIIPPGGLFTTSRSNGNWEAFNAEPFTAAGETYYAITNVFERNVVKNVTFKRGDIITVNREKNRGFKLESVGMFGKRGVYGMPGNETATFRFIKETGNLYFSPLSVCCGPQVTNIPEGTLAQGTGEQEGTTVPTEENRLGNMLYGSNIAAVGRTYLIADAVTPESVRVREMGTDSCTNIFASPHPPVTVAIAPGGIFHIGGASVSILEVSADSATVRITDSQGSVDKKLGPASGDALKWSPLSMTARERFWMRSCDGSIIVHLNLMNPEGIFNNGKVYLAAFSDVLDITNGGAWPADTRFVTRPET